MKAASYLICTLLLILITHIVNGQKRRDVQDYKFFKSINGVDFSYRWRADCAECGWNLDVRLENKSSHKKNISAYAVVINRAGKKILERGTIYADLKASENTSGQNGGLTYAFSGTEYYLMSEPPGRFDLSDISIKDIN